MIFCLVCGVANRHGSRFCNACGRRVDGVVQCAACGGANLLGSRFCNQCGSTIGPQQLGGPPPQAALGEPGWGAPVLAAPMLGEEDAHWADLPALAHRPGRSLSGIEALSADDLSLFEPAAAATPRGVPPLDASLFAGSIARARSYRAGPKPTPPVEQPCSTPDQGAIRMLARIVGLDDDGAR